LYQNNIYIGDGGGGYMQLLESHRA